MQGIYPCKSVTKYSAVYINLSNVMHPNDCSGAFLTKRRGRCPLHTDAQCAHLRTGGKTSPLPRYEYRNLHKFFRRRGARKGGGGCLNAQCAMEEFNFNIDWIAASPMAPRNRLFAKLEWLDKGWMFFVIETCETRA